MRRPWFALVESNTTGTGRDFAEAARRQGMRPVLLTRAPERYPYVAELGLDVRPVDTTDEEAVLAACRDLGSDGLAGISSSSEVFVRVAAAVGRSLGLPAPDPGAIALCRDKAETRRHLARHGVAVPEFFACTTPAMVEKAVAELAEPAVVKPSQGTGSQGVRVCDDPAAAGWWARRLLHGDGVPAATTVLVEREIRGPEYSVEVIDGTVVGITAKHVGSRPYFVETGHDFPARTSGPRGAALRSTTLAALRAVGLTTGPAHVELRLDGEEPCLIEINPRLAGGLIPRLVGRALGRDLVSEVVAQAAGRPSPTPDARPERCSSIRFLLPGEGTVASVSGLDLARSGRHVDEVVCTVSPGMRLEVEHSFKDRRGHVISVADRPEDAVAAAEHARGCIEIAMS
ncbi:ATP-grasp domain-containing protein [Spirillospora sp. CA-294931]|uniref:ATP-grasp domain-containing protein n=1 Tax=Spirillospora sp. CA-294931 TaxID=3240042 RepID=UPI003D8CB5D6